jgi:hypothetical protein
MCGGKKWDFGGKINAPNGDEQDVVRSAPFGAGDILGMMFRRLPPAVIHICPRWGRLEYQFREWLQKNRQLHFPCF